MKAILLGELAFAPVLIWAQNVGAGAGGAHFSNTITTGSVIIAAIVIVVAGAFTIKGRIASNWRDNWQSEVVRREEAEAREQALKDAAAAEREEQRDVRHLLKNELAACRLETEALRLKTDLSTHEEAAARRHEALTAALSAQTVVLQELVGLIRRG